MLYDSALIDGYNKENGMGAKSDSLSLELYQNNGYSVAVNITGTGGAHSGHIICKACRKTSGGFEECSKANATIFITDLSTKTGKKQPTLFLNSP